MRYKIFLDSATRQFRDYKLLGEKTFDQLADGDLYYQPNEATNSIAVIIMHLYGNMLSRWTNFLTEDGEKEWRSRDREFETPELSRQELLKLWDTGWQTLFNALAGLGENDLDSIITIRSQSMTVIEAIHRQLTHYAAHTGQIVQLGKIIKGSAWKSLSIPRGESAKFNAGLMKP